MELLVAEARYMHAQLVVLVDQLAYMDQVDMLKYCLVVLVQTIATRVEQVEHIV